LEKPDDGEARKKKIRVREFGPRDLVIEAQGVQHKNRKKKDA